MACIDCTQLYRIGIFSILVRVKVIQSEFVSEVRGVKVITLDSPYGRCPYDRDWSPYYYWEASAWKQVRGGGIVWGMITLPEVITTGASR